MKKSAILLLLILIILIGSFLRLYRLTEIPAGLMQDEAGGGYDAYALIQTGKDHHGVKLPVTFQAFNDWVSHSYTYQLIPFVTTFGLSVFSIRLSVVALSLVTVILMYYLGKILTGNNLLSILMAFFFSVSQFAVTISRWSIPPNTVPFYTALSLFVFYSGIQSIHKRNLLLGLSGLLFGLTLYTYPSIEGILPVWIIGSLILVIKAKKKTFRKLGLLIIVFVLTALPLFINHLTNPQTVTSRLSMISIVSLTNNPLLNYLKNYLSYYLPFFLFLPGEINPTRTVPGYGYENPVLGLFYYIGLFYLFFRYKALVNQFPQLDKTKINSLRLFVLLFPLIPSLTLPSGDFQRATHYLPIMIFIISIGIFLSYDFLIRITFKTRQTGARFIIISFVTLYLYFQYSYFRSYFGPLYQGITQWYFQNGLEEVVKFTSLNEKSYQTIVIDNTINMPYIYVLFYKKVDPNTLDYQDFAQIDPQTKWLSVKKFQSYSFQKVSEEDIQGGKLLKNIHNSPFSNYVIYDKDKNLIVKFEITN